MGWAYELREGLHWSAGKPSKEVERLFRYWVWMHGSRNKAKGAKRFWKKLKKEALKSSLKD